MKAFRWFVKVQLKAVLPNNGSKFPSIPPAGAVHTNATYENLQVLLQKQKHYEEHRWNICADVKVIAMLTVLQGGNTKFSCF
jgi:hypothetical protein